MTFWDGTRWVPETRAPDPPRRGTRMLGAAAEATLITLLLLGLIAGTALAGNGHGRGKPSATLAFESVTTVCVGTEYAVVGSGFAPDTWVTVGAYYADTTWWASAKTDASGALRVTLTATSAGSILHEAKQVTNGGRLRTMVTATLSVDL